MNALGLVETIGLIGALEASDAGAKAAEVKLLGIEHSEVGYACVKFRGDVADVQAAVDAGSAAARKVGELVGTHVIPSPDAMTESIIEYKPVVSPDTGVCDGLSPQKPATKKSRKS